jgi:hypothetical protein
MKKINLLLLFLSTISLIHAQVKSSTSKQKKSVTIEKYTDKDGNEVIEKKVLEGDAVKKESEEKTGRSVKIYADSMGKGTKIIIDENIKIMDDDENEDEDDAQTRFRSRSGFTDRTVTIKKNADGSVEIKEQSGSDISGMVNMRVDSAEAKKPSLGISLDEDMRITKVLENGAAESGGLERNDVITHFDGTFIEDYDHLKSMISGKKVGDKIILTYLRDRKEMKATLTLKGGATRVYFNR